jgi:hypothetical protein
MQNEYHMNQATVRLAISHEFNLIFKSMACLMQGLACRPIVDWQYNEKVDFFAQQ